MIVGRLGHDQAAMLLTLAVRRAWPRSSPAVPVKPASELNLPQGHRWGRPWLDHSPDARGSETPCQPLRKPLTSLSLYRR